MRRGDSRSTRSDSTRLRPRAGNASPDLRSRRHGDGVLATRRQGTLLPGGRPGNHGRGGRHRYGDTVRQTGAVVPSSCRHRAGRGAGNRERQSRWRAIRDRCPTSATAAADDVRPAGKGREHDRSAWFLQPAESLTRRNARRCHAQRSAERQRRHLDDRSREWQRDADHER